MPTKENHPTLQVDGKFFRLGTPGTLGQTRPWLRTVTYGPFPPDKTPDFTTEFESIRAANFDSIRLFTLPEKPLLDAAQKAGLLVFAGLGGWEYCDFASRPSVITGARVTLSSWLKKNGTHPALAAVYVGNEIPTHLVRWIGPTKVRRIIEDFIDLGRSIAPHLLFAYANFPSTEYLEPANADFSAFNIYLEQEEDFAAYLRRLHNIAGDRPLLISEFGMDTFRNSEKKQAEIISWALATAHKEETAGITIFSWSDLWQNNNAEVIDWNFGLTDREGNKKPAYYACSNFLPQPLPAPSHTYSVIICTRNGSSRIATCLASIENLSHPPHEVIVVDDGSTDDTSSIVSRHFPLAKLITLPPSGLSHARNTGAAAATGDILAFTDDDCEPDTEWLTRIDKAYQNPDISAAGGPNLPPPPTSPEEAVIHAAPGAPTHVLLTDTRAEHLPGCNITVRKTAFDEIGGFDPIFRTAGDDVDFCWRLMEKKHHMAFVPGAFVWHHRRPSIRAFLKQQIGYGKAEKLLIEKHPHRFSKNGEARWDGFIYGGGPIRAKDNSVIYYGSMGQAGYQSVITNMQPLRPVDSQHKTATKDFLTSALRILQPAARRWFRNNTLRLPTFDSAPNQPAHSQEFQIPGLTGQDHLQYLDLLLQNGWNPSPPTAPWDLEKGETRVLLATEYFQNNTTLTLLRIWGDAKTLPSSLTTQDS